MASKETTMSTYNVYNVLLGEDTAHIIHPIPVEIEAHTPEHAARKYFKHVAVWDDISVVDEDDNTLYFHRKARILSEIEVNGSMWHEIRRLLL